MLIVVLLFSCKKDRENTEAAKTSAGEQVISIDELNASEDFDWNTTTKQMLKLTGYANSVVVISNSEGQEIHKAMLIKNEPYEVEIIVPRTEKKLTAAYMGQKIEFNVSSNPIEYVFN